MKEAAIILAAGEGNRLGGELPKQFLDFNGIPLLWHSIETFISYNADIDVVLVLPKKYADYWKRLVSDKNLFIAHAIVLGGKTRSESVKVGLNAIEASDLVFIHDAARPFVSIDLIRELKAVAENNGNAIPFMETTEERKEEDAKRNKVVERNGLKVIQTPQCFRYEEIRQAYNQHMEAGARDDSEIIEKSGKELCFVKGEKTNIKITYPADLNLVGLTLRQ